MASSYFDLGFETGIVLKQITVLSGDVALECTFSFAVLVVLTACS